MFCKIRITKDVYPHFPYLYPTLMADLLENWHLPLTDFMQRVQRYYGQPTRLKLDRDSVVTRQSLRVAEWHLYGSSRLGIYKTQDTLRTVDLSLVYKLSDVKQAPTQSLSKKEYYSFDSTYTHKRGDKLYEGSNHLGNVLVTFTDKRLATCTEGQVHYQADVRSATDYAAFGALLDDRQWYSGLDSGEYRYGFNSYEKDNELKGTGNSYDFGYRIYDSRLGRFHSVDPVANTYPWLSSYQYASNRPIVAIDVDGLSAQDANWASVPDEPNIIHGPEILVYSSLSFKTKYGGIAKIGLSTALDFMPGVGTVKGLIEAFTGEDLVTGEKLASWERALGIIPILGKLGRGLKSEDKVVNPIDAAADARRASKGVSNVRRGSKAVDFLKKELGFLDSKGKQFAVDLGAGKELRYVDNYIEIGGQIIASELKVGRVSATSFIKQQVLKDIELIKGGAVDKIEWHFFTSAKTNKAGPTDNLKDFIVKSLKDANVDPSKFVLKPIRQESF